MFDHGTWSLWNTFEGVPVLGTLVGSGRRLTHRSVVTTTWGEWRRMHPDTTVLSLDTGHRRDYGEGVAYRAYFRTDDLMFDVPERDDRLDNKDEVLVMLLEDARGIRRPLAVSADFLEDHRLHREEHAGRRLVIVTSREGANRVYDAGLDGLRAARRRPPRRRRGGWPLAGDGGCADRYVGSGAASAAGGRPARVLVRLVLAVPGDAPGPLM